MAAAAVCSASVGVPTTDTPLKYGETSGAAVCARLPPMYSARSNASIACVALSRRSRSPCGNFIEVVEPALLRKLLGGQLRVDLHAAVGRHRVRCAAGRRADAAQC